VAVVAHGSNVAVADLGGETVVLSQQLDIVSVGGQAVRTWSVVTARL
jgi:hypothetical protein